MEIETTLCCSSNLPARPLEQRSRAGAGRTGRSLTYCKRLDFEPQTSNIEPQTSNLQDYLR